MCLSPRTILNPYHNIDRGLTFAFDARFKYMYIPCGVCPECLATKQLGYVQRLEVETSYSIVFAIMLSYNNTVLPSVSLPDGSSLPCFCRKHLTDMFCRIRHRNVLPDFKYFYVSEYGGKKHRPHYHIMLFFNENCGFSGDELFSVVYRTFFEEWRINVGSRRSPVYVPCFDYAEKFVFNKKFRNFDVQLLDRSFGQDLKLSFYNSKYVIKPSRYVDFLYKRVLSACDGDLSVFRPIWSRLRPFKQFSHFMGLPDKSLYPELYEGVVSYLQDSIRFSIDAGLKYPHYYSKFNSGFSAPLARYYYENGDIFTVEFAKKFFENGRFNESFESPLGRVQETERCYKNRSELIDGRFDSCDLFCG